MNFNQSWIAFATLTYSEIARCLRIWTQTLLPSVITMTLYFVIFGSLIGPQIQAIGQFNYMQYITPGLIMMAIITNSYVSTVFAIYLMRFQKSIDELLISPMSSTLILLSFVVSGVFRGLCVGILVLGVSLFFTHLSIQHVFIMLLTALFSSIVFALLGILNGLYARNFDDVNLVPTFVLTPLTYLGGVFYSIHMLSPFWQKISYLNPIVYIVNAFRYSLLGTADIAVIYGIAVIIICAVILFCVNLKLLNTGTGIKT